MISSSLVLLASEAAANAAEVSGAGAGGAAGEEWSGVWVLLGLAALGVLAAILQDIFRVKPSEDPWARTGSDDEHDMFVPE